MSDDQTKLEVFGTLQAFQRIEGRALIELQGESSEVQRSLDPLDPRFVPIIWNTRVGLVKFGTGNSDLNMTTKFLVVPIRNLQSSVK